jgi:hypothetical protein
MGILKLHAYCLDAQREAEPFVQGDVLIKSSSISAAWSISAVPRFALQKNFAMWHKRKVVTIGRRQKNKCNASNGRAGRFVYCPSAVRRATTYIAMASCR